MYLLSGKLRFLFHFIKRASFIPNFFLQKVGVFHFPYNFRIYVLSFVFLLLYFYDKEILGEKNAIVFV